MDDTVIDRLERRVLYELQRDARQSCEEIAKETDVDAETVSKRIDELEDRGVIDGYSADVNYDEAGVQHHYVFQCSARISQREHLARQALDALGVVNVTTLMTGTQNILIVGAGSEKDDMTGLAYEIDQMGIDVEREALVRSECRQPFEWFRL